MVRRGSRAAEGSELPGDRIAGINYTVYKVRLKNSNIQKGKSGDDRVIYAPDFVTMNADL